MPPPAILDPSALDLSQVVADREAIGNVNPHRNEFQLLDAVVLADEAGEVFAGYHEIREDAWWTRGHIPGRPLFPGVLMIESSAQLASFMYHTIFGTGRFLGFTGVNDVRFRGTVQPPARFVIVGRGKQMKPRRLICEMQGFVDNVMVFEGEITGMPV